MVEEIMLHRSQIEMIDADDPPKKILEKCLKSPYTRIPIFKDHQENVVGILHAKDLLKKQVFYLQLDQNDLIFKNLI